MPLRRERLASGESLRLNPSPKCHFGSSVTGCDLLCGGGGKPPPPHPPCIGMAPHAPADSAPPCPGLCPGHRRASPPLLRSSPPAASIPAGGLRFVREGPWLAHTYSLYASPPLYRHTRAPAGFVALLIAIVLLQPPPPRIPPPLPAVMLGAGGPAAGRAARADPAGRG